LQYTVQFINVLHTHADAHAHTADAPF